MSETYCSYCGEITGFTERKCIECESVICKRCRIRFREIDEERESDFLEEGISWELQEEYCGYCAVEVLERRNKNIGRNIYCINCGNKVKRALGNFCPKCGAKLKLGTKKKVAKRNK